jgi:hypothetical protein
MNMRIARSGKSHGAACLLSVLAALLLYVGTWPLVEFKFGGLFREDTGKAAYFKTTGRFHRNTLEPAWLVSIYTPLHRLRDSNSGHNPVAWYWEWWRSAMNEY